MIDFDPMKESYEAAHFGSKTSGITMLSLLVTATEWSLLGLFERWPCPKHSKTLSQRTAAESCHGDTPSPPPLLSANACKTQDWLQYKLFLVFANYFT